MPIPPVLVALLREHPETSGPAKDGRVFRSKRGDLIIASTYPRPWE